MIEQEKIFTFATIELKKDSFTHKNKIGLNQNLDSSIEIFLSGNFFLFLNIYIFASSQMFIYRIFMDRSQILDEIQKNVTLLSNADYQYIPLHP